MKILCRHFKCLLLSNLKHFVLFVWFESLCLSQQFFSHAGTGFPGLNSTKQQIKCLAQGHNTVTQPAVFSLTLYQLSHCTPHLYDI